MSADKARRTKVSCVTLKYYMGRRRGIAFDAEKGTNQSFNTERASQRSHTRSVLLAVSCWVT
jgi:hypothetical protein